jgi:hypothetical protein
MLMVLSSLMIVDRHAVYLAALPYSLRQVTYQSVQTAIETSRSGTKQTKTNTSVVQISSCTDIPSDFWIRYQADQT